MTQGEPTTYETFSLYGFSLNYPDNWDVGAPRKLDRFDGSMIFQSPKGDMIFTLTWGLPEVANEDDSPNVEEGARKMRDRLARSRGVKELTLLKEDSVEINSHKAIADHVSLAINLGVFKSNLTQQEARFAHFYCEKTERYFIIHGTPTTNTQDLENVFENMVKSFKCH